MSFHTHRQSHIDLGFIVGMAVQAMIKIYYFYQKNDQLTDDILSDY